MSGGGGTGGSGGLLWPMPGLAADFRAARFRGLDVPDAFLAAPFPVRFLPLTIAASSIPSRGMSQEFDTPRANASIGFRDGQDRPHAEALAGVGGIRHGRATPAGRRRAERHEALISDNAVARRQPSRGRRTHRRRRWRPARRDGRLGFQLEQAMGPAPCRDRAGEIHPPRPQQRARRAGEKEINRPRARRPYRFARHATARLASPGIT